MKPDAELLEPLGSPRKIDLAEELELAGVVVPQDVADAIPANEPVFLPYQQRWFEDEAQIMFGEKSRRTGITWAEAGRNVVKGAKPRKRGGCNTFYVGSKKEMALEYIAACALFAKAFNELAQADVYEQTFWDDGKQEEILTYMIRFPKSGFKIQALSSRPSNLRGLQGDVVIDEAAFHEKLEELLKAALALTMWGNKVRLISTHNGVENLFNQYIQEAREGRKDYSVRRITLDDAIADGLYKRICYVTGQTWTPEGEKKWRDDLYKNAPNTESADEEYGCIPKHSGGAWLSRALIESRMSADTPVLRWACPQGFELLPDHIRIADCRDWLEAKLAPLLAALPADAISFDGEDFGRTGDLTVHVPLIQTQNLVRRVPFILELRNVPFRQQEQVAFYLLDRLPRFTGAAFDARGNGQALAEYAMQRYGASRIQQVMLSEGWYREHMPPVKAALEDGELIDLPKDADILADLRAVQVVKGVPRIPDSRSTGEDKGKRHGDAAVAVALAYFASREINKGPVTVKSRRRRAGSKITQGYQ
ncbi:phage FluMu gp28-like protein [Microvirgula sp. AG722]|uniref:terminase large subunit domain-containing protein n=1 Tax=Microvirgula sp. AG722 TaxID=2183901 RepID=UPI000DC3FD93|nr:terminase family protein [Microvirgula sp. AG722]RAS18926.1 phage FluMu gp28-like protein [Microvirgula sp. AG722]